MIFKITVFKARQPVTNDDFPTIIFWVKDARNVYGDYNVAQSANISSVAAIALVQDMEKPKVFRRSADGEIVLREHIVHVGL
jgi:hypothetical protein